MSGIATAIVGSAVIGAAASSSAAKKQEKAAQRATDAQTAQFERQVELQEPFRQSGLAAQNRMLTLLGLTPTAAEGEELPAGLAVDRSSPDFGRYARDFGVQDFQQDPGYSFRLSEGLKALDRQAAARGGLISGAALKAAQRYGQDAASQEYQNAFNRYQISRAAQLNPLQSLAGQAQTSANVLGQAGQQYASAIGENYMGAANARASGYVGAANALSSGVGQYYNYQQQQQLMNQMNQPQYYPATQAAASGQIYGPVQP